MKKTMVSVAVLLAVWLAGVVAGQEHDKMPARPRVVQPMSGLGSYRHRMTTTSAQAQRLFDQGLVLVYGFNHGQAIRLFERAAELDPKAPMPLWGIALAYGPNINDFEMDR